MEELELEDQMEERSKISSFEPCKRFYDVLRAISVAEYDYSNVLTLARVLA